MKEDMSEEDLINYILSTVPTLNRGDLEKMIEDYVSSLGISRKTALYLISLEYRVAPGTRVKKSLSLDELIGGLSNVHIIGRLAWLGSTERYAKGTYVRGGILDNTSILPIIFWNRTMEELRGEGIEVGVPIEIKGCYTRPNIQGGIVIHVPERAVISVKPEYEDSLPTIDNFIKPLDQIKTDEVVFTYGIFLTKPLERNVTINGEQRTLSSFYIGYKKTVLRCSTWSSFPQKIYDIKPGTPINLYYVRSRINRFNELELRFTKYSYLEPAYDKKVDLSPEPISLKDVKIGFNINFIYLKAVAIGKTRMRQNSRVKNILVYDGENEAVLSLLDDKINELNGLNEGDEFTIYIFRTSIKEGLYGRYVNLFTTDITKFEFSKTRKISFEIPTLNVKNILTENRYVNIRGRIVSIQEPLEGDIFGSILLEDEEREPFIAIFRNSIEDYTETPVELGDKVELRAVIPDIKSLLVRSAYNPLRVRLRAFSRIVRI